MFFSDVPAIPDVGMPKPPFLAADISGWDMQGVYLQYDILTDTMYVGIDCFTICGDADNDGFPGVTGPELTSLLGNDQPDLGGTESFAVVFDTTQSPGCPDDGPGDVVAGVASAVGASIADFDLYDYIFPGCPDGFFGGGCPFTSVGAFPGDSIMVGGVTLTLFASPSAAAPDIEFSLSPFSALPGFTFTPGGAFSVELNLFGGSIDDDGIGEDEMVGVCFDQTTTTTTTSTTTTTLCIGPIKEAKCGNGMIDPECMEECDYAGLEICDNMMDDDGDGLVDCGDEDCSLAVGPTCSAECLLVTVPCLDIKDDPSIIRFGNFGKPDYFKMHGRILSPFGGFDPTAEEFTFDLHNTSGLVHSITLPAGSLAPSGNKNGQPTRFKYKDKAARLAGGIFQLTGRFRNVSGEPSFPIKLKVYGDFSLALEPHMITQWYGVGGGIGFLVADWNETNRGWKLSLKDIQ